MIAHTNYGHYHASRVHSLSVRYDWYLKLKRKRFGVLFFFLGFGRVFLFVGFFGSGFFF